MAVPVEWTLSTSLAALERRWSTEALDEYLGWRPAEYLTAPSLVGSDTIRAVIGRKRRTSEPVPRESDPELGPATLSVRIEGSRFSPACTCHEPRVQRATCPHVVSLLLDLAVHPSLLTAIFEQGAVLERLGEVRAARSAIRSERATQAVIAQWTGPPVLDSIEWAIEPAEAKYSSLANERDREPSLYVRLRRLGDPTLLTVTQIEALACAPGDRRLLDLATNGLTQAKALVVRAPLACVLLHELARRGPAIHSGTFKGAAHFSAKPVRPRVLRLTTDPAAASSSDADSVNKKVAPGLRRRGRPPTTNRNPSGSPEPGAVVEPKFACFEAAWLTEDERVLPARDVLLFDGPSPYVWDPASHTYFPVAPDVDMTVAMLLQAKPLMKLPWARRKALASTLLARLEGAGIRLPGRHEFGLASLGTPSFALRLTGSPFDVRGTIEAVYPSRTFILPSEDPGDPRERDVEAEGAALAAVQASGLELVTDTPDPDPQFGAQADQAATFWDQGLGGLRANDTPHIDVFLTERLARVKVGQPLRVRVRVSAMNGWLTADLSFDSNDVAVELSALKAALARRTRWVALSDGTLARINDKVAQVVSDAAAILDGNHRVAPHHLGRLTRWVDELRGTEDASVTAFRTRLKALAVAGEPTNAHTIAASMRPYQRQGIAWLQFLEELGAGGILADDMGLGKTLMALAFLATQKEARGSALSLVVCPTSVAPAWVSEAARFTPGLRVVRFRGTEANASDMGEVDLVVTTYAILRNHIETLREVEFRTVILDEAQNIKTDSAATTLAAKQLRATMRIALSGTPVENRLGELWSILDFVNPGILSTVTAFVNRYERAIVAEPAGETTAELRAIVRPFILRRMKHQVLLDLPPKTEINRPCSLAPAQKRLYDALALTLRESVTRTVAEVGVARAGLNVLTALLRLRQMACDPRLVDKASPVPSAKRELFLEIVRELVAERRRALVFSQFVELLTLWREDLDREGITYEYLDGSTADREGPVTRFQRGGASLFLISLKAGGAGLNLTAADTVIHCDPWWNPAVEDQATDRAYRIGQERPLTVLRLVAKGTVEERIDSLKAAKRELADAIIGSGTDGALRGLSEEDVRVLLGSVDDEPDEESSGPAPSPPLRRRIVASSGERSPDMT